MAKSKDNQVYWIVGAIAVLAILYLTGGLSNLFATFTPSPIESSSSGFCSTRDDGRQCACVGGYPAYVTKVFEVNDPELATYDLSYTGYGINSIMEVTCGDGVELFSDSPSYYNANVNIKDISLDIPSECIVDGEVEITQKYYMTCRLPESEVFTYESGCESGSDRCVDLSYQVCENDVWSDKGITSGQCGVECLLDENSCQGTDYISCENYEWKNNGEVVGECNVECTSGSKCESTEYYTCEESEWQSHGEIEGQCGYTPGDNQDTSECSGDNTKCEGETYYTCSSGNWNSQGQVDGQCGYTEDNNVCAQDVKECSDGSTVSRNPDNECNFYQCPSNGDGNGDGGTTEPPRFELDKVLFTIGDTDITILHVILIIVGLIALMWLFK